MSLDIEALYQSHFAKLTRMYSEDVAQETLERVWRFLKDANITGDLEKYIGRTAYRVHITQWRRHPHEMVELTEWAETARVDPTQLIRAELTEVIEREPNVIAAEFAKSTAISTVKVRQCRARAKVRRQT